MSLPDNIDITVVNALKEDLGQLSVAGDITASLIDENKRGVAELVSNEKGILCGCDWFERSFLLLDKDTQFNWQSRDGDGIKAGQLLCQLSGRVRSILAGERTGLNFLQTLSGTATQAAYLAKVVGGELMILDTRKTLPGLRVAQKYAITIGGCHNHRFGTYDAFLIKENHLMFCDSMAQIVECARKKDPNKQIIIEVENIKEFQEAVKLPVDVILLDNFTNDLILKVAQLMKQRKTRIKLEVSGIADTKPSQLKRLARLGIDRISLGSLTKHCRAIDFSLRFQPEE